MILSHGVQHIKDMLMRMQWLRLAGMTVPTVSLCLIWSPVLNLQSQREGGLMRLLPVQKQQEFHSEIKLKRIFLVRLSLIGIILR